MVQYYRDVWPRGSQILALLAEAARGPKGRKILWNDAIEISFKDLNRMVSAETLLNYPYWTIKFTVHTFSSDKQVSYFISQNNKKTAFFSRILNKPQRNYTMT